MTTKTVINHKFSLEKSFQEILYRIDNWINEGSGWIVELIESRYIDILTYTPLSRSSYVHLSVELRSPKKELINTKNNDQKSFLWCHVRHIDPVKMHPERMTRKDKELAYNLFLCEKKILARLKQKTTFALIRIVMKIG